MGRKDQQVKIRGFRIEPGEIESAITSHPGVREAACVSREDRSGEQQLVAYVVPVAPPGPTAAQLRRHVAQILPKYMTPSAFVMLAALPITPNGKLDRRALPAPERRPESEKTSAAPRTDDEVLLAGIWAEVLDVERLGIYDDFFELGGHSLLATRLISRVRATLGVELQLRAVFEAPTVAGLAAQLTHGRRIRPALTPRARPKVVPLSAAQRRLWFLHQMDAFNPTHLLQRVLRLKGELNLAALKASLADVLARHDSLRTVFPQSDGVPRQLVLDATVPPLTVTHTTETELPEMLAVATRRAFDLAVEAPFRAELFSVAPDEHVLVLVVHHIATDGWSMGVLGRDLAVAFSALPG